MTTTLHAQPYDLAAAGFYFDSAEEFQTKSKALRNDFGDPVEEFEIQFIDGEDIDCDLAKAIGVNQANLSQFFTCVETWDEHDKTKVIIAVGECGYRFEDKTAPDDFEVDVYQVDSLKELAEQFVDEGLFGEIPERLQFYIDYDAIARDLSVEYAETAIAGERFIYRCGVSGISPASPCNASGVSGCNSAPSTEWRLPMELQHINLNDLKPAAINVRKKGGKDVGDLIPSIRSLGVLQPLLVRPNCEGFEVVAGQRRYHALAALADEGVTDPVPCIVMADDDDAKAIEASLAENIARLPMDEIDQYKAFAVLVKQGASVEDIASQFGVTERLVTQRLAIANLIGPILTAYRKDEIDPQMVRILTMATKSQQKKWIELFKSEDEHAPLGYRLKCWLFGGAQISTDAAIFDLEEYKGGIISDLFGEDRYFDDAEQFWAAQNIAIAEAKEEYLADGWSEVIVLDIGEYFPSYEYVDTAKEDGGKVYIAVSYNGEVTPYEGQLSRKDIRARGQCEDGRPRPAF